MVGTIFSLHHFSPFVHAPHASQDPLPWAWGVGIGVGWPDVLEWCLQLLERLQNEGKYEMFTFSVAALLRLEVVVPLRYPAVLLLPLVLFERPLFC